MSIIDAIKQRRSIYQIGDKIPVSDDEIIRLVSDATELIPDAFNMKSQRVVLALGTKHKALWDAIYDVFGGKVSLEKIDSFKAGYGTVLYFYDENTVKSLQAQYPRYADNFPIWAQQANGMLQITIWSALRELNIGANIQHYNPAIDEAVKKLFNVPENYILVAQMPFGEILAEPEPKEKENISLRVLVEK